MRSGEAPADDAGRAAQRSVVLPGCADVVCSTALLAEWRWPLRLSTSVPGKRQSIATASVLAARSTASMTYVGFAQFSHSGVKFLVALPLSEGAV
jgi:hypothetical protein